MPWLMTHPPDIPYPLQVLLPNGEPLQLKLGMHVGEAYTGMLGTSPPHFQCAVGPPLPQQHLCWHYPAENLHSSRRYTTAPAPQSVAAARLSALRMIN